MFQSKKERQNEIEMVTIEELVPEDHLLRYCRLRGKENVRDTGVTDSCLSEHEENCPSPIKGV
ncbi:hypothetical protein ACFFGV_03120 [Pontibacillus salicampi]|uniref:Transposase n=1 Tax=Pontibacillus salicampi TaxID=1449801 RepID=A0ABV6LJV7_9BACI